MNAVLLPMIVANADEVDRQAGLRPSLASKHLVEYWCPKPKGGFFVSRRRVGQRRLRLGDGRLTSLVPVVYLVLARLCGKRV